MYEWCKTLPPGTRTNKEHVIKEARAQGKRVAQHNISKRNKRVGKRVNCNVLHTSREHASQWVTQWMKRYGLILRIVKLDAEVVVAEQHASLAAQPAAAPADQPHP